MSPLRQHRSRVLVTGADGFVGHHLCEMLTERGIEWRAAVRRRAADQSPQHCAVGDIGPQTDWSSALEGIDAVVHVAGRAHILRDTVANPRDELMRVNADATARLVVSAAAAGVRRFVYVSSIHVLGNSTDIAPFTADTPVRPHNDYAESKLAGEIAARSMAHTGMDSVVLRLPLVYGPGVRANFLRLLRWVDRGLPLPLGAIDNRRSLVNVWNLCDLIVNVLHNPAATRRNWVVADGEDLSTPDLIRRIGVAMCRRTTLMRVPTGLLHAVAKLTRKQREINQLCGSLVVDARQTRDELAWFPRVSVNDALARTVAWYFAEGRSRAL